MADVRHSAPPRIRYLAARGEERERKPKRRERERGGKKRFLSPSPTQPTVVDVDSNLHSKHVGARYTLCYHIVANEEKGKKSYKL